MIKELITRLQYRKIQLVTDPLLQERIVPIYQSKNPIAFRFTLFELIYAIGTCREVVETKANKFSLAADFLEVFVEYTASSYCSKRFC